MALMLGLLGTPERTGQRRRRKARLVVIIPALLVRLEAGPLPAGHVDAAGVHHALCQMAAFSCSSTRSRRPLKHTSARRRSRTSHVGAGVARCVCRRLQSLAEASLRPLRRTLSPALAIHHDAVVDAGVLP